ncbi:alpha-L-rhamnosidase N-terminal domain-containing protein [candidate division KSB1 bacterium]|nr:alpha-L-rhamnosidase N-terminal domain-containing protein [candidate division KSB1 bacterium]
MKKCIFVLLVILTGSALSWVQTDNPDINPDLLKKRWQANWIAPGKVSLYEYGIYHFRKTFELKEKPKKFIIHVSADNRYCLFVNGVPVSFGPARGDLPHWRYETVNIAPFLKTGINAVAALVWNFAGYAPMAQMSYKTAFIVQGNTDNEAVINTNPGWKVLVDRAYSPTWKERTEPGQYIVVGPGDRVDGSLYPWGWSETEYDDSDWQTPVTLGTGTPRGLHDAGMKWLLVPRTIPVMEEKKQRILSLRRTDGFRAHDGFIKGDRELVVPARAIVKLLLDQTFLTIGYPELVVSGGKGSEITLVYAEALFDKNNSKGNRNDIEDRHILGLYDVFMPDGGAKRLFRPLWLRTYRFIQMEIETGEEPLVLHDFYGIFTAYPLKENASFECDDASIKDIWNVGWRTARLCAGENYFDCPSYEQLQYVGDTRIQALISLYVAGDDRLVRNAIKHFDDSRSPDGLTASRYPSDIPQVIPTFSLFWVAMVYDYWMHRPDEAFVEQYLTGIQGVLNWYKNFVDETGMLGPMPWWNFVDWAVEWPWDPVIGIGGVPDGAENGNSSIITLQYAYVLEYASQMFETYNYPHIASSYRQQAQDLKKSVQELCWDRNRGLYSDTPEKKVFSQHANIFAILTGLVPREQEKEFVKKILNDNDLIQCTFYFRFYLTRALKKAGLADLYIDQLQPWRTMLNLGLTTFAEKPEPTRSDCHAWSSSPNYDLLATVCGIEPDSPGFKTVKIRPHFGPLNRITGEMPHPNGEISVQLERNGKTGVKGKITLPDGITGRFIWQDVEIKLTGGAQSIDL